MAAYREGTAATRGGLLGLLGLPRTDFIPPPWGWLSAGCSVWVDLWSQAWDLAIKELRQKMEGKPEEQTVPPRTIRATMIKHLEHLDPQAEEPTESQLTGHLKYMRRKFPAFYGPGTRFAANPVRQAAAREGNVGKMSWDQPMEDGFFLATGGAKGARLLAKRGHYVKICSKIGEYLELIESERTPPEPRQVYNKFLTEERRHLRKTGAQK